MKECSGYVENKVNYVKCKKVFREIMIVFQWQGNKTDADEVNITLKTVAVIVNVDPDDREGY